MAKSAKQRRVPQQARSKRRYRHILETAAALFAEHGIDQVTTNHIADSAEISIGSIYQFFPNKEAIIEGLVEQYMADAQQVFPRTLDTSRPIEDVIRQVLGGFMQFSEEKRGVQVVMIGLEGTSNAKAATKMQAAIVAGIEQVLGAYYPELSAEKRNLCATVSFALVAGLMPHDLPNQVKVDEMVLAIHAYQQSFLQREGLLIHKR